MSVTIRISKELHAELRKCKIRKDESYEDVIWDLLESNMELSEKTKWNIEKSRIEIAKVRQ